MSFQELCKKYKEEICEYCMNKNIDDCEIRKTVDGAKCVNYIKDKSKVNENKEPITTWQGRQL